MAKHSHDFVETFDGFLGFGLDRKSDENTVQVYLQKFSDDRLMGILLQRMTDEDLEELFEVTGKMLRKYLTEAGVSPSVSQRREPLRRRRPADRTGTPRSHCRAGGRIPGICGRLSGPARASLRSGFLQARPRGGAHALCTRWLALESPARCPATCESRLARRMGP